MEQEKAKVDPVKNNGGVWVALGDKQYLVPPLNFRALRELESTIEQVQKISGTPKSEDVDAMLKIAHTAVKRNYPELSLDDFSDMVDIGNVRVLLQAIMNVPGVKATPPGE